MTTTEPDTLRLDFWEWVAYGQVRGWCSDVVCDSHDGVPLTDEEAELWEDGLDPCIRVIRLYGD
jgi:hypothetical protein